MHLLHITTDPNIIAKIGDLTVHPRGRSHPSEAKRLRIYKRDGGTCQLCGGPVQKGKRRGGSLDHIARWEDGGCNRDVNLRLTHVGCNLERDRDETRQRNLLAAA